MGEDHELINLKGFAIQNAVETNGHINFEV